MQLFNVLDDAPPAMPGQGNAPLRTTVQLFNVLPAAPPPLLRASLSISTQPSKFAAHAA
jgi:hypothetical protein